MPKVKKSKRVAMNAVSDINVTPLVDVMLVLLIIFMVVTPMLQKGVSVEMAKTNNPQKMQDADKEDAIVVAIQKDGTVFLQGQGTVTRVKPEDLILKVKDTLQNRVDKTVYIKADGRAKYSDVTEVVDNVRGAGVDRVGLLTDKIEQKGQTSPPM